MRKTITTLVVMLLLAGAASAQLQYQNPIGIPSFSSTFTSSLTRGFACQIPVDLTVVGLRVPDESKKGKQYVALYTNKTPPPKFSAVVNLTPLFSKFDEKAGNIIPCSVPYKAQDWLIVLGACSTTIGANMSNSYGVFGNYNTTIFGKPTTLVRCGTQFILSTLKPPHPIWRENGGNIGRVEVFVASATLAGSGTPTPGGTITFTLSAAGDAGLTHQLGSSFGQGPIPLGNRKLEISVDKLLELSTGGLVPTIFQNYAGKLDTTGKATAKIQIPNVPALKGVRIYSAFITLQASAPFGVKSISNNFLVSIS